MIDNNYKYDFLIVGAGFAGASCARLLTDKGYKCLIMEQRPFVSGNCVTDKQHDIDVHFFGAHILHTNNEEVWDFLKLYGNIHEYRYKFISWNNGEIYPIPFGMSQLNKIYNKSWPHECLKDLKEDIIENTDLSNIENYSLNTFGKQIYEKTIKNFYEKKFKEKCANIPVSCLEKQENLSLLYNTSYYDEIYQGIPEEGYTKLVENIIGDDIDILLNKNFLENKEKYIKLAKYIIYTGDIDRFFDYCMGAMNWKSIQFEFKNESDKANNLSGSPVVHFSDDKMEWFRMTEHKWLTPWRNTDEFNSNTCITYEFYREWKPGQESFYPYPDQRSINLNNRYIEKLNTRYPSVLLCGGRPKYRFMNICETIEDAMKLTNNF